MADKGPHAFRSISEAVAEVGVPAHVLRLWETKLSVVKPIRRAAGRRFYRPDDLRVLKALRYLLHDQRRPIGEIRRLSRAHLLALGSDDRRNAPATPRSFAGLRDALAAAIGAKQRLDGLLADARS